jgi:hypothetical protein
MSPAIHADDRGQPRPVGFAHRRLKSARKIRPRDRSLPTLANGEAHADDHVGCTYLVHAREQGIRTWLRSRARPAHRSCPGSRSAPHGSWPSEVERSALMLRLGPQTEPAESGDSSSSVGEPAHPELVARPEDTKSAAGSQQVLSSAPSAVLIWPSQSRRPPAFAPTESSPVETAWVGDSRVLPRCGVNVDKCTPQPSPRLRVGPCRPRSSVAW